MRSVRLAHFSGVSTDSLRRYERLVLLARPPRTARGSPDLLVSGVWSRQRKASALWRAAGSGGVDENVYGNAYKFFGKRTLPFPYHQAELMGSLGRNHVGVTCDRTPRFPVLLPDICEPSLDRLSGEEGFADRFDGLRAHNDGEIAVDADEFDLPLERGVKG